MLRPYCIWDISKDGRRRKPFSFSVLFFKGIPVPRFPHCRRGSFRCRAASLESRGGRTSRGEIRCTERIKAQPTNMFTRKKSRFILGAHNGILMISDVFSIRLIVYHYVNMRGSVSAMQLSATPSRWVPDFGYGSDNPISVLQLAGRRESQGGRMTLKTSEFLNDS